MKAVSKILRKIAVAKLGPKSEGEAVLMGNSPIAGLTN